jgi:hypothetical protein
LEEKVVPLLQREGKIDMKTKKEIEAELKKYDAIPTFDYAKNGEPFATIVMNQDIGFQKALQWVLEKHQGEGE